MPKGSGAKGAMAGRAYEIGAANLEDQKTVNTDSSNTVNTEIHPDQNVVSLTIKVPLAYRRHWQIEAKRRNTTVTSLVVEALGERLGLPEPD